MYTNYEKKHLEDLESAKGWLAIAKENDNKIAIQILEKFFPELKESEDEKVRKSLIGHLKECRNNTRSEVMLGEYAKWIAWLEKQGENNPAYNEDDERTRKAQLDYWCSVGGKEWYGVPVQETIAWLEKQGEEKPAYNEDDERIRKDLKFYLEVRRCQTNNDEEYISCNKFLSWLEKLGKKEEINEASYRTGIKRVLDNPESYGLEKRCEKKPAVKVEPKFKVGDWIINNDKRIAVPTQILKIEEYGYVTSRGYTSFDKVTTDYHLWNIQDANDGDVLANKDGAIFINAGNNGGRTLDSYCYLSVQNKFCIEEHKTGSWFYKDETKPATKEQRDLLFQKMHEAGYEWDAEKKDLKKIEQNPIDLNTVGIQKLVDVYRNTDEYDEYGNLKGKPLNCMIRAYEQGIRDILAIKQKDVNLAWIEEDEENYQMLQKIICDSDITANLANKLSDWLRSLKPNHWKPSKEQMQALNWIAYNYALMDKGTEEKLQSLYNDLKKL